MLLKSYQQRTLDELKEFLINAATLKGQRGIRLAYLDHVGDEGRHYKPIPELDESPFVCIKVPTGGGKTIIACHSLPIMLENYLQEKNGKGLVMWFKVVPLVKTNFKRLRDVFCHPLCEIDFRWRLVIQ